MRYISLDTETTGLKVELGHKIIEVGCLEIKSRKLTGEKFHKHLNPEREVDDSATRVHGKRLSDLQGFPVFSEIANEFCEFIKNSVVIIHNAKFDLAFLNAELAICGEPKVEDLVEDVIDSLDLARKLNPGKKNSLDVLCSRYNVDNSDRSLHGALLDAELLAKVYLVMTRGQEKLNIQQKNQIKFDSNNKSTITNKDVVIKYASKFENTLHKSFLEKMKKDCEEKVLWSEDKKE
tara:strand:+ start:1512 stop:2216 length:705 start_codon:yes stop_codon:yes gene_type:complete